MSFEFVDRQVEKVVVTIHARPDGDAVGSGVALARMLEIEAQEQRLQRRVRIFCPDVVPGRYAWLVDEAEVDYSQRPPENDEYVIAVDTPSPSMLGYPVERVDLAVDHHPDSVVAEKAPRKLYDPTAPACAVVLFIAFGSRLLDEPVANALFVGIYQDTAGLRYNVSSTLFMLLHHLTAYCGPLDEITHRLTMVSPTVERDVAKHMASMDLQNTDAGVVAIVKGGRCRLRHIARRMSTFYNVDLALAVADRRDNQGFIQVELRSPNKTVAVNELARHVAGPERGGGHQFAASCLLDCTPDEAIAQLTAVWADFKRTDA